MMEIALVCMIIGFVLCGLYIRKREYKMYNNGICSCGGHFYSFAMDSQGGTGWKCNKCNRRFWTSWVHHKHFRKD